MKQTQMSSSGHIFIAMRCSYLSTFLGFPGSVVAPLLLDISSRLGLKEQMRLRPPWMAARMAACHQQPAVRGPSEAPPLKGLMGSSLGAICCDKQAGRCSHAQKVMASLLGPCQSSEGETGGSQGRTDGRPSFCSPLGEFAPTYPLLEAPDWK